MNSKVDDFLIRHGIDPSCIDIEALCDFKIAEMRAGANGDKSSVAMLKSYCTPPETIPVNRKVAVIDAGGTNLRTCAVYFDENLNPVFEDYARTSMPGIESDVDAKQFFGKLADETERLVDSCDAFGFCFSYAAKILADGDGVPLLLSKEIKAADLIGKPLGKELFKELEKRGHDMSEKRIIVMNDTVTTLLAGLPSAEILGCDGCVGFILGTGTNTACIGEDGIVNEESAGLRVRLGDIDKRFTDATLDPQEHLLEKAVGGAYLGPLALLIVKTAAEEGLFSAAFAESVKAVKSLQTYEMCASIMDSPSPLDICINSDEDACILKYILKKFVSRVAKLAAANLAASILYTGYGMTKPVLINADGTTFYNTPGLEQETELYLSEFLKTKGRSAVFTNIRRSPMIGSAIGALSISK